MGTSNPWPPLPLKEWQDTYATLHLWTQIVGKVRMALAPPYFAPPVGCSRAESTRGPCRPSVERLPVEALFAPSNRALTVNAAVFVLPVLGEPPGHQLALASRKLGPLRA